MGVAPDGADLRRGRNEKESTDTVILACSVPLYTIVVESNHVSGEEQGYMKLFIPCGGADDPRPIKMRQRGSDGKWFLWEQYLLTGVRMPKSADPWA